MDLDINHNIAFSRASEKLPRSMRMAVFAVVVSAHAALAWGVMQVTAVRQAVISTAPTIFVQWIAPPAPMADPEPVIPPPPLPPIEPPKEKKRITPKKVTPKKTVQEPVQVAVAVPVSEPVEVASVEPTNTVPEAVAAPAASPPRQVVQESPRVISVSEVRYRVKPNPEYPKRAQRYREQGQVMVRVLIDTEGSAAKIMLDQSSGSSLLDQAAIDAVRRARFYPYLEGGAPMMVWVRIPISFTLKS